MSLAAVILAAGASLRMGRPKALIEWQGRPFCVHLVESAAALDCDPCVVVDGACSLSAVSLGGAIRVTNQRWQDGPLSSLQVGLREVDWARASGVLVFTVDRPHVAGATLQALVSAHRSDAQAVLQPELAGRHGHPILYPRDVAQALLSLPPTSTPRELLGRPEIGRLRGFVCVEDPAVLENIDTPEALDAMLTKRDPIP